MKRFLPVAMAAVILLGGLPAFAGSKLSGAKDITHTSGQDDSNASVTAVTATADRITRIYKFSYHVDGADTVTLSCGSTAASKSVYTFGGEGGVVITPYPFYIECDSNTAVTLTKGTAGTLLEYDLWTQKEAD